MSKSKIQNFPFPIYSSWKFGDSLLVFYQKEQQLGMSLIPAELAGQIPPHRQFLKETIACRDLAKVANYPFPAYDFEPLTQLKFASDAWPLQNAAGTSMRNASSCAKFKIVEQKKNKNTLTTVLKTDDSLLFTQAVRYLQAGCFEISTSLCNQSKKPQTLEYLASFSLGLLSPFQNADSIGVIHRFRSAWSAECRHVSENLLELGLEASWQGAGVRSLRFGQNASVPVKNFYPFLALEDTEKHTIWGAEIIAPGPWELELSRRDDFLNLSGGLPCQENNGWSKILQPGKEFSGPKALVCCVHGPLEELLTRMREYQEETVAKLPGKNQKFPIVFNEWCSSWGTPGTEQVRSLLKVLPDLGVKYCVLDAGWFAEKGAHSIIGDWNEAKSLYPLGLHSLTDEIQKTGITPGIWFEFENGDVHSRLYREHPDFFHHGHGEPLRTGNYAFLNFTKPEVWKYLDKKVIQMMKKNRFGYIKVDYNAFIPCGADGTAETGSLVPAEMLRQHLEGVTAYFAHLREKMPQLVIEACAAGGHRCSPWWVRFADMVSGTDAHEGVEIPLIAANQALLIPARALQVWAALRPDDDEDRICYSLASACLGRLVLSGNVDHLCPKQLTLLKKGIQFYQKLMPILNHSTVRILETVSQRWTRPIGKQMVLRSNQNGSLLVFHFFEQDPQNHSSSTLFLPGKYKIEKSLLPKSIKVKVTTKGITLTSSRAFTGGALLLQE